MDAAVQPQFCLCGNASHKRTALPAALPAATGMPAACLHTSLGSVWFIAWPIRPPTLDGEPAAPPLLPLPLPLDAWACEE